MIGRLALNKRLTQIRAAVAKLKRERATVNREKFVEMFKSLRQLPENTDDLIQHTKNLATQFTRIAQNQAGVNTNQTCIGKGEAVELKRVS
jgi:hypothetical protein